MRPCASKVFCSFTEQEMLFASKYTVSYITGAMNEEGDVKFCINVECPISILERNMIATMCHMG
jgi:hypothetical protein